MKLGGYLIVGLMLLGAQVRAATYTVTSTNDSDSSGTLRWAINSANTNAGSDTIAFNISGASPFSIYATNSLPIVTQSVNLDGSSQPGYVDEPLVFIDGSALGFDTSLLTFRFVTNAEVKALGLINTYADNAFALLATNSASLVVQGCIFTGNFFAVYLSGAEKCKIGGTNALQRNVIYENSTGIRLSGSNTYENTIIGNYIGVDATGTNRQSNYYGILIYDGAYSNRVGAGSANERNIISGNSTWGVRLRGSHANRIQGNYIGVDAFGTMSVPNDLYGVALDEKSSGNWIGGTNAGEGNVISGNNIGGISINNSSANYFFGNWIGLDGTGTNALGNNVIGVNVAGGACSNIIGSAAGRNVISGNWENGIEINDATSMWNKISGNYIGLDRFGSNAVANAENGVRLSSASFNMVGGTNAGEGNIISGNDGDGIAIEFEEGGNNEVYGNYIGTDRSGTYAIPNGGSGVDISNNRTNRIGGAGTYMRNIISGNTFSGVALRSTNCIVQGNYIGLDSSGQFAISNGTSGIQVQGSDNLIGGTNTGEGNVVSGNTQDGMEISGMRHAIYGNYVGTDATGTNRVENHRHGISLLSAISNWIGSGTTSGRNIVSGNGQDGINFSQTANNLVYGNYIGLDLSGQKALTNGTGIYIEDSSYNYIGGTNTSYRNIISGNATNGIYIRDTGAFLNYVQNNYIGTDANGTSAVPNRIGIYIYNADSNVIGQAFSGNVISGNKSNAVYVYLADGNEFYGNYVGLDASGKNSVSNNGIGIFLRQADSTRIGSSSDMSGNVVSGNRGPGIYIHSSSNIVLGANRIGVDASGTQAMGNAASGIFVYFSQNISIGTHTSTSVISGNGENGIVIWQASNILVQASAIGTDSSGVLNLGNAGSGVLITNSYGNHIIGGGEEKNLNLIAFNGSNGITITSNGGTRNDLRVNLIYSNAALSIDLNNDGITANDSRDPDSGPNDLQNFPVLTTAYKGGTYIAGNVSFVSNVTCSMDFYLSYTTNRQGQIYIGSTNITQTNAAASKTFTTLFPYTALTGMYVTATATDTNGNTSEFSAAVRVTTASDLDSDGLPDYWESEYLGNLFLYNGTNDVDGDGFSNLEEYIADTDPDDSSSLLELSAIARTNENIYITAEDTSIGRVYDIQFATNLTETWFDVETNQAGESAQTIFAITGSTSGCLRVKAKIP